MSYEVRFWLTTSDGYPMPGFFPRNSVRNQDWHKYIDKYYDIFHPLIEPQRFLNINNVRFGVSELVISESSWSPEFIQELLPSAERTALLYHLSLLCLGSFPKLERKIREQAIETQMLFRTTEAVLLKCVGTSSNLVTSLFPILIKAVEKNKPKLAVIYLEKARTWINDIIRGDEVKALMKFNQRYNDAAILAKQAKLNRLVSEKDSLRNKEWNIKIQRTDLQLKLANCKIQQGAIPDPVHLKEVQTCLDRIQQNLVDLKKFWKKVAVMLETLKDKTFVGDVLFEDLEDMKEEFIQSIEDAKLDWKTFGECCQRAQVIFSIQSRTAYKFLEINPSSFSEAERIEQYKFIMAKLRRINPEGSTRAAITE
ncbi:uncharacterized protein LOC125258533 [Megalobrama amblycephala]|uniref:uncharacterized protein LOC125258533 n=1 Tax=Megalobrama amblycephala TaxID=75352 RepID=UPI002013F78A|nr:uncharacterized protein LOC125258533 [Megalobrama amblycephala]